MNHKTHTLLIISAILMLIRPVLANDDNLTLYGNESQLVDNIVITIDDASIESNVRTMFDFLKQNGATATVFPNTRYLNQQDPQLWQQMVASGFEIGYHTRRHRAGMTPDELTADFAAFQDEIRVILNDPNYTIRYVRPPGGLWNDNWMSWANANHLMTVRWNVTDVTEDMAYLEAVVKRRDRGGSIILLHTGLNDVDWLKTYLPVLMKFKDAQSNPYRITSISGAFGD